MKRLPLGRSGIEVSDWCLGTMTFGNQTPESDAHSQIDRALDAGLDFMDTAEMYPTNPVKAESVGRTEEIIGNWIAKSGRRDDWTIATKVTGPNGGFVREGKGYDGEIIKRTVEHSLRRLQTDRIDLYQLHWPERGSYHFRQNWRFDPSGQDREATRAHMLDVLSTMDELVKEGKVRAFGLSNETCWGTEQWIRLAEDNRLPRVASVQNEYNLLNRLWDTDMAEMSVHEEVPLMAFSPLAAGLLTAKYEGGEVPEGSRMSINGDLGGRATPRAFEAVSAYAEVARNHGLQPLQLALAWLRRRPFPVMPIIGATTVEQLDAVLAAEPIALADEMIEDIEATHKAHPMPY